MRQTFLPQAAILLILTAPLLAKAQSSAKADGKVNAVSPTAVKVDLVTLAQGEKDFESGKFVQAEKLLRAVLDAINAGTMPQNQVTHCLVPLTEIYRAWGRYDDALQTAQRYHDYIQKLPAITPGRDALLDKNANDLADILTALDRPGDAERYLQEVLAQAEQRNNVDPVRTLNVLVKMARVAEAQGDQATATKTWSRVIVLGTPAEAKLAQQLPKAKSDYSDCIAALAAAYEASNRLSEAIGVYQRLLSTQKAPDDAAAALRSRVNLASIFAETGQSEQALKVFGEALDAQRRLATNSGLEAELLSRMAKIYGDQGNNSEAGRHWEQASIIYSQAIKAAEKSGDIKGQLMGWLNQLQIVERESGHYQEAIQACKRLLDMRQKTLGDGHPLTTAAKSDLGELYGAVGNFEQARPFLVDALTYWQKRKLANPLQLARIMNDLAVMELGAGSLNEAKELLEQALAVRQKLLSPDDERLAATYANLATVFLAKGDYARALEQLDQAIDIYRAHGASAQESLSKSLLNRALIYRSQGLYKDAFADCREALEINQAKFGNNSPGAIQYYNTLASLSIAQRRYADAAQHVQDAWRLCQKNKLEQEPIAGATLYEKARIEYKLGDTAQAQRDWKNALAIQQQSGQTLQVARTLNYLADIAAHSGQASEAEKQYRQALRVQGSEFAYPRTYFVTNCNLAEILHAQGKADEAIKLVQNAVKVIETPRSGAIGGEAERAETFADFDKAFDLLVSWNLALGRVDEAFASAEQGRNRTFLDQLSLAGVDLRDTLTGPSGEKLLERERSLRSKFATLQAEARAKQPGAEADKLVQQLSDTQIEYAKALAAIHNASSYYRDQLSQGDNLKSLAIVRQKLGELNSVMLFYYAGAKLSFLLLIDPDNPKPQIVPLEIPDQLAAAMSVKAGPVTREDLVALVAQYLKDVRDHAGGRGLTGIVFSDEGIQAADQGTQLAEVLVPPAVRNAVYKRAPQSVIIVPDGALCELPFEALLLERQPKPKYLLDVFPPIAYVPSANILMNLLQRSAPDANTKAILTIGNPKYSEASTMPTSVSISGNGAKTVSRAKDENPNRSNLSKPRSLSDVTRAAYLGLLGDQLPALPATALECAQIASAFQASKTEVRDLEGDKATEGNFRAGLPGCRFIHIAAHGLVDQQNENLFGAIALTPPPTPTDSKDDGFLSVNEIFNLPLSGCELVALSACQTNVGPDRPLEAGSTIAQAFLAAGARRAVCSHWNVDDKSTAELMGSFFEKIAKSNAAAGGGQNPISYAQALHDAQREVRLQKPWSSPYYWAPFVLIGPPQ